MKIRQERSIALSCFTLRLMPRNLRKTARRPHPRHRLRRRARALVRSGAHPRDLHALLATALRQRDAWWSMAVERSTPRVPDGLVDTATAVASLESALAVVSGVLHRPGTPELVDLPLPDLEALLEDLSSDVGGLRRQPRRTVLLERLRRAGLGVLVDALRARGPEDDGVAAELDLAWWASVLEAILRDDPQLAHHQDGGTRRLAEEYARADRAHLDAGAMVLRARVVRRAVEAVRRYPGEARWLRTEVARGHRSVWPLDLVRRATTVLTALRPVWVMSPDAIARLLPPAVPDRPFADVVIVDDAAHVPLPEVAASLARGRQVIVAGDPRGIPPASGAVSVLDAVAPVACRHRLATDHRARDGRLLAPLLPEGALALKWPNDVLVNGRKICGILTEATWIGDQLGPVILGIGLNVRADFAGTELEGVATSLEPELERPVDRHVLLANLLGHVFRQAARAGEPALIDDWRRWLGTLGRRVTVFPQVGDSEAYQGIAEDVDDSGALFVRLDTGERRRIVAADVGLAEA